MNVILESLKEPSGAYSSKRILSLVSCVFYMIMMILVVGYLMIWNQTDSAIERNLPTILIFAGSLVLVPQGLASIEKFKNGGN